MNDFIQKMTAHVSVRSFVDEPLKEEIKQELLTAANSASSSNFVQAFSIIEITDKQKRQQLGEIANCPEYVIHSGAFYVFVADLYRQKCLLDKAHQPLAGIQNMEALLVSVVDTTIAAQNMVVAAEAMDLGICYIGGIRNDLTAVSNILNLPKYTVPIFGMTIGIPTTKNDVKPRMPLAQKVAQNSYDQEKFTALANYQKETAEYYANRGSNQQQTDWLQKNIAFFSEERRPEVGAFLKKQGFSLN
ncbi:oxygen-insensitive NADPH nitroreductase [Lactobacillus sp. ESL0785]|uniref:oxygen-insensitive NADPH nitroreductase n=1 Tax=Lactobacillus sp. ESL0785 TaxID=2983232 RepID=UPI0023F6D1BA|nr:oxygen-insensitive NADPH nitroreductase [Lactobacillus sp. ESL0785]WEV70184.1 oxygen-insensitive NADPH nitroreductase [Lactobacillus sp. ESL0785]